MSNERKVFYLGITAITCVAVILIHLLISVYGEARACRARGGEPTYDSVTGVHCFSKELIK